MTVSESSNYQDARGRVMETASGTTSPDNAQSGSFAYVIAAVAIVVSILLGTFMKGCMSFMGDIIMSDYEDYGTYAPYDDSTIEGYPFEVEDFDDFDYLFNEPSQGVWGIQ